MEFLWTILDAVLDFFTQKDLNHFFDIKTIVSGLAVITIAGTFTLIFVRRNSPLTTKRLERMIELERKDAIEQLQKANNDIEEIEPLRKINAFDKRLANLPQSLQEELNLIEILKTIIELENEQEPIDAKRLADVKLALENGNFSKIDTLFSELGEREGLTAERASSLALARGYIAERNIQWHDANKHFSRAAKLDPYFNTLLKAQTFAFYMGDNDSALSFSLDAQKVAINEYGENSEQYVIILNNLGGIYQEQGRIEEARETYMQALAICKKELGEEHPYTAESINYIGVFHQKRGEYEKAEVLFNEALIIKRKVLGEYHPDIANTINNLASIYFSQGLYEKAEPLFKQALKIRQDALGKTHLDIAISLNNLAGLYYEQEYYKKAEPLLAESLEMFEAILGHESSTTKNIKINYENLKTHLTNAENDEPQ